MDDDGLLTRSIEAFTWELSSIAGVKGWKMP